MRPLGICDENRGAARGAARRSVNQVVCGICGLVCFFGRAQRSICTADLAAVTRLMRNIAVDTSVAYGGILGRVFAHA